MDRFGLIHCFVGLAVPELQSPLLRIIQEGTVEVADIEERYARNAVVWFHLYGVMIVLQGLAWRQYVRETKAKELPNWWGWTVTTTGLAMGKLMPSSGWLLLTVQGIRVIWRNYTQKSERKENDDK